MNRYEGLFVVDNAIVMNDWDNLVDHIQGVLTKHKSENLDLQKWGERKLAYKIGLHTRGTYILVRFEAPGDSVLTIRKEFELSDKVIRILIVRDDKPEGQPTINSFDGTLSTDSDESQAGNSENKLSEDGGTGSAVAESVASVTETENDQNADVVKEG